MPIIAKLRSGRDKDAITCTDVAAPLEDAGCAAVAFHPRARAQGYVGFADWVAHQGTDGERVQARRRQR